MGHAYADVELSNPRRSELAALHVTALAGTGAMVLCIPKHVALQLGLETEYEREVTLAEGRRTKVPYVGQIRVSFGNRGCFVGAFVLGDTVLLGVIPMEDMDLVVDSNRRAVVANPENPKFAHALVKGCPRARRTADASV
jgi:clan AA aspartic protease